MARKRSASRSKSATILVARAKIPGRQRGGRSEASNRTLSGLLSRLRRVEFAVLHLMGRYDHFDLDTFANVVLQLDTDAKDDQGRSID